MSRKAACVSAALALSFFFGPAAVTVRAETGDDSRISQDDDDAKLSGSRDDDDARRAAQRRRSLSARGRDFDPRVFEARGRELQGEYYEITTMAPSWSPSHGVSAEGEADENTTASLEPKGKSHFWAWCGGLALAGAAGAVGYYFLGQDEGAPAPRDVSIPLDDKP